MRELLFACPILLLAGLESASQATPDSKPDEFIKRLWLVPPGREADALQTDRVVFVRLMFDHQPDEENHREKDDPLLPNPPKVQEPLQRMPEIVAVPVTFETPFVAGDLCGMIVFVSGVAGWIALGVAVLIVERPRQKT